MAGTDVMGKGAHPDFSKPNGLGDLVSISGSEKPWWSWLLNYWRAESFNKAVDPHFAGWELRNMAFLSVSLVSKSCLTLCYPMDCSPSGSSVHGDFSGRNTGVGCHFLLQGTFPTQGSSPHLLSLLHCRRFFTTELLGKRRKPIKAWATFVLPQQLKGCYVDLWGNSDKIPRF